ncbi:Cysteine desulfurase [Geobacter metallireducens RCH3]|nr:cysteine desulfurase family protein [Geobacter metallireducens]EHP86895.1 Cysteine desulfurase [Geobacter metallireducens RCH3]
MIYLDHNATTPVHPDVVEALLPFLQGKFGNPSSIHWAGRAVKGAVEEAREQVSALVGCEPGEVVFTSSGTEADNMAIKGVAAALGGRGNHIVTTQVEHPGVANPCLYLESLGFEVTRVTVDRDGLLDLERLEAAITDRTILISAMAANNETGVLFPVREIGEIAACRRVYFHCDGVQAAGRIPLSVRDDSISFLALSGHKLYAPKGIGALVVRRGVKCHPLIHGGSQERNRRGGTENVAGIVAFGRACAIARETMNGEMGRIKGLRDRLEEGILSRVSGACVNGHREQRLPTTTNITIPGVEADSLLMALDLEGIAASSGSACSSGTLKLSPVLAAMGRTPEEAKGSVRFSLGKGNTVEEIDRVLAVLPAIVARLRGES